MAQATQSVYEAKLRASMIGGVCTIAHQRARDAVKRQLRDKGLRVSHFSAKEISLLADEYFAQHPELINEAATRVERLRVEGYLGKRAQSVRNLPQIRTLAKPEAREPREIERSATQRQSQRTEHRADCRTRPIGKGSI